MATGLVIHISSGEDRHTEILTEDNIRIGTTENCDLRLRASGLPKEAANAVLLELARANGAYRVTGSDQTLPVTLNGDPVQTGAEIHDGDEVRVGNSDFVLHSIPCARCPRWFRQRA